MKSGIDMVYSPQVELIFLDCQKRQNSMRNFILEMGFSEQRRLQLESLEMDFSMAVGRISVEWVMGTAVVIMATLMMSQMSIAICPTTIHFVAVLLTGEDDGEEEKLMNCLSIQREGKLWTYIIKREKENLMPTAKARAQYRVPVPSPPPRHGGRRGRWGQVRLVGAGKANGGKRGWWGQARLVGAGEADGGRKPPATSPRPPALHTREATGPNP